ncbi:MAG TPA: type IV secretory system conjugative DNA transfer family protein [Acidimicrobiales bacterium]
MSGSTVTSTVVGLAGLAVAGLVGRNRSGPGRRRERVFPDRPLAPRRSRARVGGHRSRWRGGDRGPADARWARPGDLRSLAAKPPGTKHATHPTPPGSGRLVLGRAGKRLLATEPRQSVIVFGPTQSRKTSGFAVPSILEWEGPVIATSVKADLVGDTIAYRRRRGEVACFDPSGSTGLPSAAWSPLPAARTWPGARRVASSMTDVGKTSAGTMGDGDFWYATATKMLAPLLFAAASGGRQMTDVVRWVDTQEEAEVLEHLSAAGVPEAVAAAHSLFGKEERQRSSIYTTVETILEPFGDEGDGGIDDDLQDIDASRLVSGDNTLYLCAPAHDQRRLSPLFTAVLRQVLEHVYDSVTRTGSPLDPPLLVVLDEAANIAPLSDLDSVAATAAGHGVQLVSIWHDLAQITARYGSRSATVVNNHRAKVFLSGISDPSTLDYATHLIGDEEVLLPAYTSGGPGGPTTTRSPSSRRLAPPQALRRIPPGEGVLVYGGLPPAWLRLRTFFDDPVLAGRAAG